jgi:GNAT superfamily N-acetyltransferase
MRKLTGSITAPATWIKTFVDAETLRPWIADGTAWEFTNPGFLMSVPLGGNEPVDAPAGYQLRIWRHGGLTRGLIVSADGSFAARAQTGEARHLAVAVFDQVETAPEHRRRGLGSVLMRALAAEAAQRGARLGVLGATPEGRRLYESLGWTVAAPLTSLILDPAHASAS